MRFRAGRRGVVPEVRSGRAPRALLRVSSREQPRTHGLGHYRTVVEYWFWMGYSKVVAALRWNSMAIDVPEQKTGRRLATGLVLSRNLFELGLDFPKVRKSRHAENA